MKFRKDISGSIAMTNSESRTASTAHTPGPWTIEKYSRLDKEITILEPRCMVDNDDVDPAEAAANARLIAAAPDMLSVLKFFACIDFDRFTEHDEALLEDVKRDAAAAISKATGAVGDPAHDATPQTVA